MIVTEDTWQIMEFNLHVKISNILEKILSTVSFSINQNDYCLVLEDNTSDSSIQLDFEQTLSVYDIPEPDNVSLFQS